MVRSGVAENQFAVWISVKMRAQSIKSRRELARRANVSSSQITRIIRHGVIPGPDIVRSIARVLKADEDTAMEIAGYVQLSDAPSELPPEMKDRIRRFYRLPESEQTFILESLDRQIRHVEDGNRQRDES